MPRSGPQGTATPPPGGFPKNPGDVIPSAAWNQLFADLYAIANTPTPIAYGGTGEATPALPDGTWRFKNTTDPTKLLAFDVSPIATATTRTITMGNADVTLRPQAWELIGTFSGSGAANISITGLSAYRRIRVTGTLYASADNVALLLQTSTTDGVSYDAASGDYEWQYLRGAVVVAQASPNTSATSIDICGTTSIGNNTDEGSQIEFILEEFNQSRQMRYLGSAYSIIEDGSQVVAAIGGRRKSSVPRNAFRLIASVGNLTYSLLVEGSRT